ncbi:Amino acid ABC transporter periplasmic protein [Magnetospirillum sp. XM-1]|uniref:ABC transporter substrate-binding protein n=1 Tax=Magnetospirillum sp. XM-1 TaxID=1663591 RepID=UPI00073E0279|nr:ABC transporter substrate-binding protein [Magnetospirillum sp. XM-1]CUW40172.1 Amino acid ABC transporter periplasmic protein [Magnetospirillum sp. XM-1]
MHSLIRLFAILSAFFLASQVIAAPAGGRLAKIRQSGEVRVCIWPDYYSISYRNTRTGKLEGIDIDMAGELAKDLGVQVRFVDSSFKTLIDDLLSDKCDISMHAVAITPPRQEKLAFTRPHLRSGIVAITTKTHPVIKEWSDIDRDGIVVAAATGTFMVDVMKSELKQARLLEVATPEAREQEVMSGRADLFVTDYPFSRKMLARHDWAKLLTPPKPLAPSPYAYAMAPGDAEWLDTVDSFVARTKADGRLMAAARANGLEAIVELK